MRCGGDRVGLGGVHDRDVDHLVAVVLGAPCLGALEALGTRLAHPHRLDPSGVGGRDLEQPVDPGADHEQAVDGVKSGPVLGA